MNALANSLYCRLCGEENKNGIFIYESEEGEENLSELINKYLPVKVSNDGRTPRTICPGCNIQLDATVQYFKLIIKGQQLLRDFLRKINKPDEHADLFTIDEAGNEVLYGDDNEITLLAEGRTQPKRKRGRPPKKQKTDDEIRAELEQTMIQQQEEATQEEEAEIPGKRRRKAPKRFQEIVQGKELERIFREEGVIEEEEDKAPAEDKVESEMGAKEEVSEVIGRLETNDGSMGELIVVTKGKRRGRPKGATGSGAPGVCPYCKKEFKCKGRYMAHIASHQKKKKILSSYNTEDCCELPDISDALVSPIDDPKVVAPIKEEADAGVEKNNDQPPAEDGTSAPDKTVKSEMDSSFSSQEPNTETEDSAKGMESEDTSAAERESNSQPVKKVYTCPHCNKTFNNKQNKWVHVKGVHNKETPYSCDECGKSFPYRRSLHLHSLVHRKSSKYACDLCGKVLKHPSSVMYHKETEHTNQRYACLKCDKSFRHKQLLLRHQLVHSTSRPFTCKVCNSTFKTRANLHNHQVLHTGIKPYACHLCSQTFAHKTSHTLHLRWHNGIKPYSCEYCGKRFSQKGNLVEHERTHTGLKPYQCKICPRTFTTSSQMKLHTQSHNTNKEEVAKKAAKTRQLRSQLKKIFQPDGTPINKQLSTTSKQLIDNTFMEIPESIETTSTPHKTYINRNVKRLVLNGKTLLNDLEETEDSAYTEEDEFESTEFSLDGAEVHLQDSYGRKIDISGMESGIKVLNGELRWNDTGSRLRFENGEMRIGDEVLQVSEIYDEIDEDDTASMDLQNVDVGDMSTAETDNVEEEKEDVIYVTYAQQDEFGNAVESATDEEVEETNSAETSMLENVYSWPGVTDEHGNNIQVGLQNTNQRQMKSLQILSQDGQTFPLEIDNINNQLELSEEGVQILTLDAHYYTVV